MGLSNTAVPKYYGQFREKVISGEIPVCKEISMQMNRIDAKILDPKYYYDESIVDGFVQFCNNELTLTDGSPMELLDSFKLWAEDVFGWYTVEDITVYDPNTHSDKVIRKKNRLCKKQYLIVPRGAAKSMYATCMQSYVLVMDKSTTKQIVTAPTQRQAEETLGPMRTAIVRSRGPLFKCLSDGSIHATVGSKANRAQLCSTKQGIEYFLTGSTVVIVPMSIDKLQGFRPKLTTIDEWLSGAVREDVVGAVEQGASKMDDYLIIATSSEGTVRNGPGDDIKMELSSILKGEYQADQVSIFWYKLDDVKEVGHPELWLKANPNLGKTVKYLVYHQDVERAEKAPAARNDILAKRFNLPMEGYTYFFTYEETQPHPRQDFRGNVCAMGADLSRGDDFCSFTFMFPNSRGLGIETRCYISDYTYAQLPQSMKETYQEFVKEGSLVIMNGSILDMMEVYDELDKYITENDYDVRAFGYDPYNARTFVDRWEVENGPFGILKVIQGAKTESVPLGELKILSEQRNLIFWQKIMKFCMGNCIALEDTNGNRKLSKDRHDAKIDAVAAMMDAYIAMKENKEAF